MSSSNADSIGCRVVVYTAADPPSAQICDEALRFIGTHEDRDTLNGMCFTAQGTERSAGDLPYYRFLIMEDPTATTHVCSDESGTICGVLISHVQEELTDESLLSTGEDVWNEQTWVPALNRIDDAEEGMKETLSPDELEPYEVATEISVLSFPKKQGVAGELIGKALLDSLPLGTDHKHTTLSRESQVFLKNGFKVVGSQSEYNVQITGENPPYMPPEGEIEIVFLLKENGQPS